MLDNSSQHLDALRDIKQMMERSSRFISLSGWSGIAAGLCALAGAWFAYQVIEPLHPAGTSVGDGYSRTQSYLPYDLQSILGSRLLLIALLTFAAAFILAFIFTYLQSQKNGVPVWGKAARRLMVNVSIPLATGGIFFTKAC